MEILAIFVQQSNNKNNMKRKNENEIKKLIDSSLDDIESVQEKINQINRKQDKLDLVVFTIVALIFTMLIIGILFLTFSMH